MSTYKEVGPRLFNAGLDPIPVSGKRPTMNEWQTVKIDQATVDRWAGNGHADSNVGIRCGVVSAIDVDVYNPIAADQIRQWIQDELLDGKEFMYRIGQAPKFLIPCNINGISSKKLSTKYIDSVGNTNCIEILSKGQQFVAYGIHPGTGKQYRWKNGDLVAAGQFGLPTFAEDDILGMLFDYFDELAEELGWTVGKEKRVSPGGDQVDTDGFLDLKLPSVEFGRLKKTVMNLPKEWCSDRDEWVRIGMIIHHSTFGSAEGLKLYDDWSQLSTKYNGLPDIMQRWASFHNAKAGSQTITFGSIAEHEPQVSDLFDLSQDVTGSHDGSQQGDWPEPTHIEPPRHPVATVTAEMIPDGFRGWVTDIADRMQCPIDYLATSLVVVCGSLIGTACSIRPKQLDDWTVVPNLWGVIVGPPAQLKTPAQLEIMRATVEKLEARAREHFELAQVGYEAGLIVAKERQKAIQKEIAMAAQAERKGTPQVGDINRLEEELRDLHSHGEPTERRYKTNDASVEKIVELLNLNPRGLLYYRDEVMGLFRRMEKPGNEQDRTFLLEAWNGSSGHVDDRIGRGTTRCDNLCISLLGSTQHDKLLGYLRGAITDGTNDGFVQRLQVMVYPDTGHDWKYVDRLPDQGERARAFAVTERLDALDMEFEGGHLRFSEEAQEVFIQWLTYWQNEKLKDSDLHPVVAEHLAKYRSLMPSLALIFHLIDLADRDQLRGVADRSNADDEENRCKQVGHEVSEWVDVHNCDTSCDQKRLESHGPNQTCSPVSRQAAEMAILWCEYLESHARRIYSLALDAGHVAASILADKIIAGKLSNEFRRHQVVSKKWGALTEKKQVQEAIELLIEHGWLREKSPSTGSKLTGRPTGPTYQVNPRIISK